MTDLDKLQLRVANAKRLIRDLLRQSDACKAAAPGSARVHLVFDGLDDILTDILDILEGDDK